MDDQPKPFLEHLEELRLRLIKSLAAVLVGACIAYQFTDELFRFLAQSAGELIFLYPTEAFFVRLKIALVGGIVIALPVVCFQIWRFIFIALTPQEQKSFFWILPLSVVLFLLGSSFGLFVLVPAGLKFLLSYGSKVVVAKLSVEHLVNFVFVICLVLGAVFQMPLVTFFLAKFGILDSQFLSGKRRMAVLVIYIFSALATPGPDPVTAILLALPTYLLFECSLLAAKWARRCSGARGASIMENF